MKEQIDNLVNSFTIIFRGLKYTIINPWVWKYVALAIILNILSFIMVIFITLIILNYSFESVSRVTGYKITDDTRYAGQLLFTVIGLFIAFISFNSLTSIINAPIYNRLRERIWVDKLMKVTTPYHPNAVFEIYYAFKNEIKEFILMSVLLVVSTLINLIPVLGQILFIGFNYLQLILNTGIDLFDPIFARREMNMNERIEFLILHPTKYWPFLLTAGLIASLPIINIFTIPILNVSAMLLYEE